jgi:hypothetical protein
LKILDEFGGEEFKGLCSASENIVDDVVELLLSVDKV